LSTGPPRGRTTISSTGSSLISTDPGRARRMVHELADAGVPVWVSVTPWVPGVTDITSVARGVGSTIPTRVAPLNVNSPEVDANRLWEALQPTPDRPRLPRGTRAFDRAQVCSLASTGHGPGAGQPGAGDDPTRGPDDWLLDSNQGIDQGCHRCHGSPQLRSLTSTGRSRPVRASIVVNGAQLIETQAVPAQVAARRPATRRRCCRRSDR
jgi:hypothetical protein